MRGLLLDPAALVLQFVFIANAFADVAGHGNHSRPSGVAVLPYPGMRRFEPNPSAVLMPDPIGDGDHVFAADGPEKRATQCRQVLRAAELEDIATNQIDWRVAQ